MRYLFFVILFSVIVSCAGSNAEVINVADTHNNQPAGSELNEPIKSNDQLDILSYVKGLEVAKRLNAQQLVLDKNFNLNDFILAIRDFYSQSTYKFSNAEIQKQMRKFSEDFIKARQVILDKLKEKNKIKIESFLKDLSESRNIKTTSKGLKYYEINKGKGTRVKNKTSLVDIHIKSYLPDGQIFFTSYLEDESHVLELPRSTPVGRLPIVGLQEVLLDMKVGDKWLIHIPYQLAYGETGSGSVPAKTDIIIELALLAVEE